MKKNVLAMAFGSLLISNLYAGTFNGVKKEVFYNVNVEKNVDLRIDLRTEKQVCNTQLSLLDSDNNLILKAEHLMSKGDVTFNAPIKKGKYTLKYELLSTCNAVNFDIGLTEVSGNFEVEINDNPNIATPIQELNYNYGYLQRWDDIDYYAFNITQDAQIKLYFEHQLIDSFGGFKITILDANSKSIKSFSSNAKSLKDVEQISLTQGKYFIKVEKNDTSSKVQHHRYSVAYMVVK